MSFNYPYYLGLRHIPVTEQQLIQRQSTPRGIEPITIWLDIKGYDAVWNALTAMSRCNDSYFFILAEYFEAAWSIGNESIEDDLVNDENRCLEYGSSPALIQMRLHNGANKLMSSLEGGALSLLEEGDEVLHHVVVDVTVDRYCGIHDHSVWKSLAKFDESIDHQLSGLIDRVVELGYWRGVRERENS